ncbi:NAD-dependent epimerase/dehydratase family protein [Halocatena halophila]|uniref:NAD-dependent epimerase/dehydratase family protein n=1 Tax=Halocatena halophila TaxID=2814576 RepID=UPI002ED3D7DD
MTATESARPTVAITGAAGFTGSRLVRELTASHPSWSIVAIDNFYRGSVRSIGDVPVQHVDVRDRTRLESVLDGADVVVHLAALSGVDDCQSDPDMAYEVNVVGTGNVVNWCQKTGAGLVFPLSMAIVGDPQTFPITVEHPRQPVNWYGRTKVIGEQLVDSMAPEAFPAQCFIKANLFGAHEIDGQVVSRNNVVQLFTERALRGDDLSVYEPGTQARNYLHVGDAARAYVRSVETVLERRSNGTTGVEKFEIAADNSPSVLDVAGLVQEIAAERGHSVGIERVENPRTETLVSDFAVDTTTAESLLDWEAQHGLTESIEELFELLSDRRLSVTH